MRLKWRMSTRKYTQCILFSFQYGGDCRLSIVANSVKEYEIITLIYNRKTFIIIFYVWVYNISHPTFHDKVWSINMCKYKMTRSADSVQIVHFCISSQFHLLLNLLFLQYNHHVISTKHLSRIYQPSWLFFVTYLPTCLTGSGNSF